MAPPRTAIGYVVRKFPVLSETFILNEILALDMNGAAKVAEHLLELAGGS